MAVPYIFANTPGGASIPLSELDDNFSYITGTPTFGNVTITGTLGVGGATTLGSTLSVAGAITATSGASISGVFSLPSLTQGSVLFIGNAGAVSQDNLNLFWNDTLNRLGIGTNTPGYTLDVNGPINGQAITAVSLTTSGDINANNIVAAGAITAPTINATSILNVPNLNVSGITTPLITINETGGQNPTLQFNQAGVPEWFLYNDLATNGFNVGNGTVNPAIKVGSNGNVGIDAGVGPFTSNLQVGATGTGTIAGKGNAIIVDTPNSLTSRNLYDRFSDFINVHDYGIVGDGVTNQSTAILALLTTLGDNAKLFFPKGTYIMGGPSTIIPTNNVWFQGEPGTNFKRTAGGTRAVIEQYTDYLTFDNITFDGNRFVDQYTVSNVANNGSGLVRVTTSVAVNFPTGATVNIYNVGGNPGGINNGFFTATVINANTFDLQGTTFSGTYTGGGNVDQVVINLFIAGNYTTIQNCNVINSAGAGVNIDGWANYINHGNNPAFRKGYNTRVLNCNIFDSRDRGVVNNGAIQSIVDSCVIQRSGGESVTLDVVSQNCVISNNMLLQSLYAGNGWSGGSGAIGVDSPFGCRIIGNLIAIVPSVTTTYATAGIRFNEETASSSSNTIVGNTFRDCDGPAIYLKTQIVAFNNSANLPGIPPVGTRVAANYNVISSNLAFNVGASANFKTYLDNTLGFTPGSEPAQTFALLDAPVAGIGPTFNTFSGNFSPINNTTYAAIIDAASAGVNDPTNPNQTIYHNANQLAFDGMSITPNFIRAGAPQISIYDTNSSSDVSQYYSYKGKAAPSGTVTSGGISLGSVNSLGLISAICQNTAGKDIVNAMMRFDMSGVAGSEVGIAFLGLKSASASAFNNVAVQWNSDLSQNNYGSIKSVSPTGGVGYGAGAGGTVTQTVNKSNSVTLNNTTGQITMNNAALASGASVVFTLFNSVINASDVVFVNCGGGEVTGNSYSIQTLRIVAGGVGIRVTNITGGSLSESVVINFVVIKGSAS